MQDDVFTLLDFVLSSLLCFLLWVSNKLAERRSSRRVRPAPSIPKKLKSVLVSRKF